ncbi:MAG: ATP-binding cassette domain-containing protein [Saprospiraceae bacterium]
MAGYTLGTLTRHSIPGLRRKLGIVFQDFNLLTDRTVFENLDFVLRATDWKDASQRNERIRQVLTQVGLEHATTRMPFSLSGGEQQE